MGSEPALSVIIVNWNVRELLRGCLESLKTQMKLDSAEYEILVVDNASSDGSVEMLQECFGDDVRLTVNRDNVGFGRANNQVLGDCRGPFILLLNPDTTVVEGAVDQMLGFMRAHPEIGALGCRLINSDGSFQRASAGSFPTIRNVAWNYLFLNRLLPTRWAPPPLFLENGEGTHDVDWVSGAAMMLRRDAVQDRLFDERFFMFGEDMELCDRLHRDGRRVVYMGDASIVHLLGRSLEKQVSGEITAAALEGPRLYYVLRHGRSRVWWYDLILLIGSLMRWPVYRAVSIVRPDSRFGRWAVANRRLAASAARSLLGRR